MGRPPAIGTFINALRPLDIPATKPTHAPSGDRNGASLPAFSLPRMGVAVTSFRERRYRRAVPSSTARYTSVRPSDETTRRLPLFDGRDRPTGIVSTNR